jgi:hypothetical protein
MLIVVYWHSAYMCCPSEMFKMFSIYTDTLSKSFRNACTYCVTKLYIILSVKESVFDEKLTFFKYTLNLSQPAQEIIHRCKKR